MGVYIHVYVIYICVPIPDVHIHVLYIYTGRLVTGAAARGGYSCVPGVPGIYVGVLVYMCRFLTYHGMYTGSLGSRATRRWYGVGYVGCPLGKQLQ